MRGLAALSVIAFHVSFAFGVPTSSVGQYLYQRNAGPPITAVILFFLISGFVLYRPFVAARFDGRPVPALVPYAVRRFARIVPAYWVALGIATLWLGLDEVKSFHGLVRYFGFLQAYGTYHTSSGGIGAAWTLCVEVTFYAALPLLALAVRRLGAGRDPLRSELALCASLWIFSLAWQVVAIKTFHPDIRVAALTTLLGSFDLFAAGMLLAVLSVAVARRPAPPWWVRPMNRAPWLAWLLAAGALYGEGKVSGLQSHGLTVWWVTTHELKLLGAFLLLAPLVIGAVAHGRFRAAIGSRPLVWLGTISYGVYLWHQPISAKLTPHVIAHGEKVTMLAVAAMTVAVAAVSFYALERPAQHAARRWLQSRAAKRRGVEGPMAPEAA